METFHDSAGVEALARFHETKDPAILHALHHRWEAAGHPGAEFVKAWLDRPEKGHSSRLASRASPEGALNSLGDIFPNIGGPGVIGRGRAIHFTKLRGGVGLLTPSHSFVVAPK